MENIQIDDEEWEEIPPPTPDQVARRALVLTVVSFRGFYDQHPTDPAGAEAEFRRAVRWLNELGLRQDLSAWELKLLETPFGKLTERDRVNASWLSEGLVILAWGLGRCELPDFDAQCDPAEVANSLGLLAAREDTVLNQPGLRNAGALSDYNEFIYNVHWRLRDYSLNRNRYDFETLARNAWDSPILRYGLKLSDKDLSIAGVPISEADESDWRTALSITQERHRASNWLVGYASEDFYEVTTDT